MTAVLACPVCGEIPPVNGFRDGERVGWSVGCCPGQANAADDERAIQIWNEHAASVDTHPKGGDGEATAPFMGGAVPNDSEADAHD